MITSTYDWKINTKEPDAGFFKLAKEHGLVKTAAKIAYERGIRTEEALEDFLKADLSHLHDPYLLHDMDKAVATCQTVLQMVMDQTKVSISISLSRKVFHSSLQWIMG